MLETPISGQVFAKLLDKIIEKSNQVLEDEGHYENGEKRLDLAKMSQKRLFGYDEYRRNDYQPIPDPSARQRTISAALFYYFGRPDHAEVLDRLNLNNDSLDPRKLDMAYAKYKKFKAKKRSNVTIAKKYLVVYLNFIGYNTLIDFANALLPELEEDGPERHFYYRCHYYATAKGSLTHFDATFTDPLDEKKNMTVRFNGEKISTPYVGEIKVYEQEREAIITAFSEPDQLDKTSANRPLIITITKQSTTPFHRMKVCVGYYLNASRGQLENSCGLIIFEQLESKVAKGVLLDHHLRHFLMHPPQGIANGGFESIDDFKAKFYTPYEAMTRIAEDFTSRYYQAFLLSKKARDESDIKLDYLEVSKFEFYAPYRVRCFSNYTTHTEFVGELTFILPNRVQIDMSGQRESHYQILLDIPAQGLDGETPLRGVYSGMTQNGNIAAGRVLLYPVSDKEYNELPINIYSPHSREAQAWVKEFELDRFFGGELDDYMDNSRASQYQLASIFEGSSDLKHLPGVYYYYRTRTIRGHMRETKRFPILLRPDGEVVVKIKAGGESTIAVGTAVRIKECIYIHLKKADRYDGLAILWPPSLRNISPADEIIPALYVSNSKRFHVTAGRLFFIRQFDDGGNPEAYFEQLVPRNIDLDKPEDLTQLNQKERYVINILRGQLNNYMAIREATELKLPNFSRAIYLGACHLAHNGQYEEAFEILYLALLRAGYREEDTLRSAFGPTGDFANQELAFRSYCEGRYDTIHNDDQRKYLEDLFTKIFPSS